MYRYLVNTCVVITGCCAADRLLMTSKVRNHSLHRLHRWLLGAVPVLLVVDRVTVDGGATEGLRDDTVLTTWMTMIVLLVLKRCEELLLAEGFHPLWRLFNN